MPRIEVIPTAALASQLRLIIGDASPTVDVCKKCATGIIEGDDVLDAGLSNYAGNGRVGSTDVDHPPYSDDKYICAVCGSKLDDEDDA